MRKKTEQFSCGGRQVNVFLPPQARGLAFLLAGEEIDAMLPSLAGELAAVPAPLALVWCAPCDWERDYTPWPAPALPGRPPFAGGADRLLDFLCGEVKPEVCRRFALDAPAARTALAGYSLGGLAALYGALSRPAEFGRAAGCSGSLWYDGWEDWLASHPAAPGQRLYLSLGKTEERSRDARMARVGDATRRTAAAFAAALGPENTALEWHTGGHFTGVPHRLAQALAWLARD